MQNGLKNIIDRITVIIKIVSFRLNNEPKLALIDVSTKESGIAPSRTPAGQIYLQKYGLPIPNSFTTRTGKIITETMSIKYFMYLNGFNFFVENFLHGILCKISWIKPNGHKNPQTNLPTITPTKIKNPLI